MLSVPFIERKTRRGESIWTPMLEADVVTSHGARMSGPFVLDTGADLTHIPKRMADQLGVDLSDAEPALMSWGDDHETTVYRCKGWIAHVAGMAVPLTPMVGDFGSPVFGGDFFRSFRVTFDWRARVVELEPLGEIAKALTA